MSWNSFLERRRRKLLSADNSSPVVVPVGKNSTDRLRLFGIRVDDLYVLIKLVVAIGTGLGGAILGAYCLIVNYLPQNLSVGDGVLLLIWLFFFAIAYGVVWVAEFSAALLIYWLLRPVIVGSEKLLTAIARRTITAPPPLPDYIQPMVGVGVFTLPMMIFVIVELPDLRMGMLISLFLLAYAYGLIISAFKGPPVNENAKKAKVLMYVFLAAVPAIPGVMVHREILSVARFAGVRAENVNLIITSKVAYQIKRVETTEGIKEISPTSLDNCEDMCVIPGADVIFSGLGDKTVFELVVDGKRLRFIVPETDVSFSSVTTEKRS